MRTDFEIIVIGGGVAGVSAAKSISETSGISVALVEGRSIGANNPTPLTFRDLVEEQGLGEAVKAEYPNFSFHNFRGSSVEFRFEKDELVTLDYRKACKKLLSGICHNSRKFVFISKFVSDIQPSSTRVDVTLDDGVRLSARLLIDASGRGQLLARRKRRGKAACYSHVYGASLEGANLPESRLACYLLPNRELGSGGGWFYSTGESCASFGYAQISNHPLPDTPHLCAMFERAKRDFEPFASYLKGARIHHLETGTIPISYIDEFAIGNIVAVGDAAGMATNWTCMGVEPALRYGSLAGRLCAESLVENDMKKLRALQVQWEAEYKESHDSMARHQDRFWMSDHHVWEWILKNDLARLTPRQLLQRLRHNRHLLKKKEIVTRAVKYKFASLLDRRTLSAKRFLINECAGGADA